MNKTNNSALASLPLPNALYSVVILRKQPEKKLPENLLALFWRGYETNRIHVDVKPQPKTSSRARAIVEYSVGGATSRRLQVIDSGLRLVITADCVSVRIETDQPGPAEQINVSVRFLDWQSDKK